MCGIAGIVELGQAAPPTIAELRRMADTLVHRGPDEEGLATRGPVGLAMRRLSVIDPAAGHQPLYNEDRSVAVVFNGEIYNYRELRNELVSRGHRFGSATDGEVIAHLWEERGADCLASLNGMFALALHDARRGRVLLARDRLGIKPLYYIVHGSRVVFGSEIKALLAAGVPRDLDVDGLAQLLAWEYVPAPRTLLRGVRKLAPAERLEVDLPRGRATPSVWWDLPPPEPATGGEREWTEALEDKIGECVRRQLVSDVPLGAFLSGGVDSSLVVAAMPDAHAFSIGFDDPSYDELPWARTVARHLGVRHEVEVIRPDVAELFPALMHHMDDPIGDVSIFPTYLVSRLARRSVTVALTGDGGDELFGGYDTYVAELRARALGGLVERLGRGPLGRLADALPPQPQKKGPVNKLKRFVEGLRQDRRLGHARWRLYAGDSARLELFTPEALRDVHLESADHVLRLFERAGPRSHVDRCLYVDLKSYLPENCLAKVDRMSMACSLEARVPLLDHELVEMAFRVPAGLKVDGGATKRVLKLIAERRVPAEAIRRAKQGFSIPLKNWLRDRLRPLVEELLDERRLAAEGLFRAEAVARLKREHLAGRANHSHVLWTLMVFQDWRRRWAA